MMKTLQRLLLILLPFNFFACESTYYAAMEKVGQHKRDILIDRVESANDSQQEAQQEFKDALKHLAHLIQFDGNELTKQYELSKEHFEQSKEAAENVSEKINNIENERRLYYNRLRKSTFYYGYCG